MDGAFSHALAYFNQTVTHFREILGSNFLFSLLGSYNRRLPSSLTGDCLDTGPYKLQLSNMTP